MISSKRDLKNKCIVIPTNLKRKDFVVLREKLKSLGFDDKAVNLQDTRYGISICFDSLCDLAWYTGIVEGKSKNLTLEEFLK